MIHQKAYEWDCEYGRKYEDRDYWEWDKVLLCHIPVARPCDTCGEVKRGGVYLCDECAEFWCECVELHKNSKFQGALLIGASMLNWPTWRTGESGTGRMKKKLKARVL